MTILRIMIRSIVLPCFKRYFLYAIHMHSFSKIYFLLLVNDVVGTSSHSKGEEVSFTFLFASSWLGLLFRYYKNGVVLLISVDVSSFCESNLLWILAFFFVNFFLFLVDLDKELWISLLIYCLFGFILDAKNTSKLGCALLLTMSLDCFFSEFFSHDR